MFIAPRPLHRIELNFRKPVRRTRYRYAHQLKSSNPHGSFQQLVLLSSYFVDGFVEVFTDVEFVMHDGRLRGVRLHRVFEEGRKRDTQSLEQRGGRKRDTQSLVGLGLSSTRVEGKEPESSKER